MCCGGRECRGEIVWRNRRKDLRHIHPLRPLPLSIRAQTSFFHVVFGGKPSEQRCAAELPALSAPWCSVSTGLVSGLCAINGKTCNVMQVNPVSLSFGRQVAHHPSAAKQGWDARWGHAPGCQGTERGLGGSCEGWKFLHLVKEKGPSYCSSGDNQASSPLHAARPGAVCLLGSRILFTSCAQCGSLDLPLETLFEVCAGVSLVTCFAQ